MRQSNPDILAFRRLSASILSSKTKRRSAEHHPIGPTKVRGKRRRNIIPIGRNSPKLEGKDPKGRPEESRTSWASVKEQCIKGCGSCLKISLIIMISAVLLSDFFKKDFVIVDPFQFTSDLGTQSPDNRLFDARLAATISGMIREAKASRSQSFVLPLSASLPDIEVPTTHTSIKSIIRYLQEFPPLRYVQRLLGFGPTRINGFAVVESGKMNLVVSIAKRDGGNALQRSFSGPASDTERILTDAAEYVLQELDPEILAFYFYQKRKMDDALAQVQYWIYHDPKRSHIAFALWSSILIDQGRFQEAVAKAEQAVGSPNAKTARDQAIVYNTMGRALLYRYKLSGSGAQEREPQNDPMKWFDKATEIDPTFALPYNNRGSIYVDKKLYAQAIEQFKEAMKRDPDFAYAYYNLALAERADGSGTGSFSSDSLYRIAFKIDPNDADIPINLGNLLMHSDPPQLEKAIEMFQQAIKLDDADFDAWSNLGSASEALGDQQQSESSKILDGAGLDQYQIDLDKKSRESYSKAVEACKKAIFLWKTHKMRDENGIPCSNHSLAKAYNNMGAAFEGLKDYDAALENYGEAAAVCPDYILPRVGLGDVYRKERKFDQALKQYEYVIGKTEGNDGDHLQALVGEGEVFLNRPHNSRISLSKDIEAAASNGQKALSLASDSDSKGAAAALLHDADKLKDRVAGPESKSKNPTSESFSGQRRRGQPAMKRHFTTYNENVFRKL